MVAFDAARCRSFWVGLSAVLWGACTHAASFRLVADGEHRDVASCEQERRLHPTVGGADGVGRRTALVFGNNAYPEGRLENARNDAKEMAERLERLGFQVSLHFDATHEVMKRAVEDFRKQREESAGLGLFYFAGHGLQFNGLNYLVPVDAHIRDAQSVEFEAIAAEEVLRATGAGGGYSIAILDACRDNPFASTRSVLQRGLAMMNAPSSMLLAYATAPGATAADDLSTVGRGRTVAGPHAHGVFTGALLQHIEDEGLTVEQMLKRTAADVRALTNQVQRPWIATDWPDDVYLRPRKPALPADVIALATANRDARDYLSVARDLSPLLAPSAPPISAQQRTQAEQLLADAQRRLGTLALELDPSYASLRVDGTLYRSNEGNLCLNPGEHQVEISEDGYRPLVRAVHLHEGSAQILDAKLSKDESGGYGPQIVWTLGAVGATALVTSLATRVRAGKIDKKLDEVCGGSTCPSNASYDWRGEQQTGHRLFITSGVMLGAGLASLATATALVLRPQWFSWNREHTNLARLSCDRAGCAASSGWTF